MEVNDLWLLLPPICYLFNNLLVDFPGKTLLILYHVNPDYAAIYNSSSASSQDLTGASSDINNGQGIFTGLNSDTLSFYVYN